MSESPIIIVDSNYIGHQAKFTMKGLSNGEDDTGVLYGFLSRVLSLGQRFQSNCFVFCWDSGKSYRKILDPEYKANRGTERTEEEWKEHLSAIAQFKLLRREILPAMGFKNVFLQAGCEGDDLIARMLCDWLGEFIVVASDEDLLQCIRKGVCIYNPTKNLKMTGDWMLENKKCLPSQWAEIKSIAGCTTDNVKGIPGIGETYARKFLNGVLKEDSKAYQTITKGIADGIVKRTRRLVKLPFSKTRPLVHSPDKLSYDSFVEICLKYGFDSFMDDGDQGADVWEEFLGPEFGMKKRTRRNKRKRPGGMRR